LVDALHWSVTTSLERVKILQRFRQFGEICPEIVAVSMYRIFDEIARNSVES